MKLVSRIFLLSLFGILSLYAADPRDLIWTTTDGEVTITDCDEAAAGELVIPNTIGGNPVTSIGDQAFHDCSSLTSITIGNRVTSIGHWAFRDCSSLTSITIPDSVTSIGDSTFSDCTSLTSITIPDSVTSIGNAAFDDCSSLTSVTIGGGVTSIAVATFLRCDSLTSITIPDSVTSIEQSAFWSCTSLTSITIPDSVTSIGNFALRDCSSLTSITIPDSVTSIGVGAFRDCTSLTSITIPDSVTTIGGGAFESCTGLRRITIGAGVTSIGDGALYLCTSLTSVTIPDSVTSIGDIAFYECDSLTSITIPDSVTSIGEQAFAFCISLTSITIGNSVASIEPGAFWSCTSLTSITIPDSVTSIGDIAFDRCSSLTSITIPDSVTSIGSYAFNECGSLTSITIPDSVTSIGQRAFYECTSLTSVTLLGAAPTVGSGVFLNVPNGATAYVDAGFAESFGGFGSTWEGLVVSELSDLTYTTTDGEVTITDCDEAAAGELVIPDTIGGNPVTSIGIATFFRCRNLTSITFPDSVTSIGRNAFEECPAVIEIRQVIQNQLTAQLATVTAERDARPTTNQLAAVEAERDARPTAEALITLEAERDAILTDIQLAYDEVAGRRGAAEEDLIAVAPASSATIFDLVWTNSGNPADTIEMTIEFPEGTVANPVELGFDTSIQGSVLTIDYQGTVTVINEPNIVFSSPVELDFSQELIGQNGFGTTLGQFDSGDFNLFDAEVPEGTFTGLFFFTLGAPDGSEYILTSMLAPVTSRFNSIELNPLTELYSSLTATNEEVIAARDAAIAERDARPTTEELVAVEAERDARFTEDQILALSADYTIGLNNAGNVQMKFNLFESTDLNTFAPLTLNPDSVSVVDGSICLEFAPEDRAAFFRFSVE